MIKIMDRMTTKKLVEPVSVVSKSSDQNATAMSRVGFLNPDKSVKIENDRKKYLTAKYGQHQMALIKKRLNVELWLIEELAMLYPPATQPQSQLQNTSVTPKDNAFSPGNNNSSTIATKNGHTGSSTSVECDIDLDDLLDLERDEERRRFLRGKLADCPQPALIVARFIEDVLLKAKSLWD